MQTTSQILMIRPVNFTFNAETAVNNAFQKAPNSVDPGAGQTAAGPDPQREALEEFDGFVALLRENDVDVTVIDDTPEPYTPDSIFPNNWISFHEQGLVCLYPMYALNRRLERKPGILKELGHIFHIA